MVRSPRDSRALVRSLVSVTALVMAHCIEGTEREGDADQGWRAHTQKVEIQAVLTDWDSLEPEKRCRRRQALVARMRCWSRLMEFSNSARMFSGEPLLLKSLKSDDMEHRAQADIGADNNEGACDCRPVHPMACYQGIRAQAGHALTPLAFGTNKSAEDQRE